jgi:hypothetical protein
MIQLHRRQDTGVKITEVINEVPKRNSQIYKWYNVSEDRIIGLIFFKDTYSLSTFCVANRLRMPMCTIPKNAAVIHAAQ